METTLERPKDTSETADLAVAETAVELGGKYLTFLLDVEKVLTAEELVQLERAT